MEPVGPALVLLLLVFSSLPSTETSTYSAETTLRTTLKSGYDTDVRPDSPTRVAIQYNVRNLLSLDVATELMETAGWLAFIWSDGRLVWDPTSYGGISALEVDWTWRPKFIVTNHVGGITLQGHKDTMVRVYSNGYVRWLVPILITTTCSVDITYFPFDSQSCYIENMFWNSDKDEVTLYRLEDTNETNTGSYLPNGEWDMTSTKVEIIYNLICCPEEELPTFNITLNFSRKRPYYVINLLLPSLLMSICIIWTFLLPVDSGERIGYVITIMLTYTVLMTITSGFLPTSSSQTPHISSYLLIVFAFSLAAVSISVINVKLFFKDGCPPEPVQKFFRIFQKVLFCRFSCQKKKRRSVSPSNLQGEKSGIPPNIHDEPQILDDDISETPEAEVTWRMVSEVLDRMFFYIYLVGIGIYDVILIVSLQGGNIQPLQL